MSAFQIRRVRDDASRQRFRRLVALALPLVRTLQVLRRHAQDVRNDASELSLRRRRLQRMALALFALFIACVFIIGSLQIVVRLKEFALGIVSVAAKDVPVDDRGQTNVLLLGKGDDNHDGIDLTDTIMLASIDAKVSKSVVLFSIPRDTYVLSSTSMGKGRINSLYRDTKVRLMREGKSKEEASAEALTLFGQTIGDLLGIQIHGVVLINFSGFVQAVDLLGGIDIDVPAAIVDPEYPGPNYTYETFHIDAGQQHLDGETALKYARSRHTTSDFSRSKRQQQVIAAIASTLQQQGIVRKIGKVSELLGIVSHNIESTFTSRELLGLATLGRSLDPRLILNVQLSDRNGLFGSLAEPGGFLYTPPREEFEGASVLLPVSIPEFPVTWKQIQAFIYLICEKRALFLRPAPLVVRNAGAPSGAARLLAEEMTRYAFSIRDVGNYGKRGADDQESSFIVVRSREGDEQVDNVRAKIATATAKLLSDMLSIPLRDQPSPRAFEETDADLAIVLAKDYRYSPLQDVLPPSSR